MRPEPVYLLPGNGVAYSVVGDHITFLVTGAQTGGSFAAFRTRIDPGAGPPRHIHSREDEAFLILEGEVTFTVGVDQKRFVVGPGGYVSAPRGVPHCFKNESDRPAAMLVTVVPAGIEDFFASVGTRLGSESAPAIPPDPAAIARLLATAPHFGLTILPD